MFFSLTTNGNPVLSYSGASIPALAEGVLGAGTYQFSVQLESTASHSTPDWAFDQDSHFTFSIPTAGPSGVLGASLLLAARRRR